MNNSPGRAQMPWLKYVREILRDYRWTVLAVLAITALLLGLYGFSVNPGDEPRSKWDNFYLALQLFTFESGVYVTDRIGWELQVARLLAPAVTIVSAALALMSVFFDQYQLLRLRFVKKHVVICGLGAKGWLLAKRFRADDCVVVVIERDPHNSLLGRCREQGIFVLQGSATDSEVLRRARVNEAWLFISVCAGDGINAEVTAKARELLVDQKHKSSNYAHIVDLNLLSLLRRCENPAGRGNKVGFHFFNVYDSGVRALLREHPPFTNGHAAPVHVLVIGLGALGERLVVQAAEQWNAGEAHRQAKSLDVTVVDREAEMKTAVLRAFYPAMNKISNLTPLQMSIDSLEFRQAPFFDPAGASPVTHVYVCLDEDEQGLSAALMVFDLVRERRVPVVLCITRDEKRARLVKDINSTQGGYESLQAFDLLGHTCRPESLLDGTNEIETFARLIHENYALSQQKSGKSPQTNPSMVAWEELPEGLKLSNRDQAAHIKEKLAAVGCALRATPDRDGQLFELDPEEVELMARMEHARWVAEREREGWKWKAGPKDTAQKTNPHLVEWEELPDEVQEFDHNAVRALPAILASAGYQIYRRK